jgi:hypothetical protein
MIVLLHVPTRTCIDDSCHPFVSIHLSFSFPEEVCSFKPIEQARTTSTAQICASYSDVESAVGAIQSMLGVNVAPRWYQMGVTLGTRVADLEAIRLNKLPAQDSERRMLVAWLNNTDMTRTTWQWLVDAVGHSAGGNYQRLAKTLAKKIAAKLAGKPIRTYYAEIKLVNSACRKSW